MSVYEPVLLLLTKYYTKLHWYGLLMYSYICFLGAWFDKHRILCLKEVSVNVDGIFVLKMGELLIQMKQKVAEKCRNLHRIESSFILSIVQHMHVCLWLILTVFSSIFCSVEQISPCLNLQNMHDPETLVFFSLLLTYRFIRCLIYFNISI